MPDPDLTAAIHTLMARALAWDAEEEHVTLTIDPSTGFMQTTGPYPDAHQATVALVKLLADLNDPANNDGAPIIGTVVLHSGPGA